MKRYSPLAHYIALYCTLHCLYWTAHFTDCTSHCTVLHTALYVTLHWTSHCTVLYTALQTALYSTVLHCTPHCTVIHTVLYCTVLYTKYCTLLYTANYLHCPAYSSTVQSRVAKNNALLGNTWNLPHCSMQCIYLEYCNTPERCWGLVTHLKCVVPFNTAEMCLFKLLKYARVLYNYWIILGTCDYWNAQGNFNTNRLLCPNVTNL